MSSRKEIAAADPPACADCAWLAIRPQWVPPPWFDPRYGCTRPIPAPFDPVTGKKEKRLRQMSAADERRKRRWFTLRDTCGPEGKYFVPKRTGEVA